jgi:hypothetical protein
MTEGQQDLFGDTSPETAAEAVTVVPITARKVAHLPNRLPPPDSPLHPPPHTLNHFHKEK